MIYSIFIILSVILLYIYHYNKNNNDVYINMIFFLMWVIFAIEFYTTKDYPVYYEGFYDNQEHWEYIYTVLIQMFKPFGFITFNAVVAAFEMFTFCFIFKKIVPPKYRWLSLAIIILNTDNLFIYMNLKRQFFAMMVSLWIIYFLLYSNYKYKYIYAFLSFLCAINIHSSAYISVGYFLLPLLNFRFNKIGIFVIVFLYLASYSFKLSSYSDLLTTFLMSYSNDSEYYEQYVLQQADYEGEESGRGFFNNIYNILLFIVLLIFNKKFNNTQFKFVLCAIFSLILMNILKGNFFRLYLYYSIFNHLIISIVLSILYAQRKMILYTTMMFLALAISIKSYLNAFVFDKVTYMTIKYKHFYTIFHEHPDKSDYLF